ncbi:MAG: hypothetical protein ACXWCG_01070 [Flavitalea sp.]
MDLELRIMNAEIINDGLRIMDYEYEKLKLEICNNYVINKFL